MNIEKDIESLKELYVCAFGSEPEAVKPIAGAGSGRRYYVLCGSGRHKVIGTIGEVARENEAFISLSRHFRSKGLTCVPEVYVVSPDGMSYLQSYAGDKSVFDLIAAGRTSGEFSTGEVSLLGKALEELPRIQFTGAEGLDFNVCYPQPAMDSRMVRWDLDYFKYCFLKPSGIVFDEPLLQTEFDRLEDVLLRDMGKCTTFIHRDFQSRNVMVGEDGKLTVIDFQGGRRGPVAYDVASFLWQAKAALPAPLKRELLEVYVNSAEQVSKDFNPREFRATLPCFVLFRVLQTLGAYGFRGWVERKPHFLASIDAGIRNLYEVLTDGDGGIDGARLGEEFPVLRSLATELYVRQTEASRLRKEEESLGLTVDVGSFSYKKGLPADDSGNGGGFVFDCRATHNPGRYEPYKKLTGMDAPVIEFLEKDGEILDFLESCYRLVDNSVERYLKRGFTHLSVHFGCTGGQHRSVYSAESMARHLREKYGVRVKLTHREQGVSRIYDAVGKASDKDMNQAFDDKNPASDNNNNLVSSYK